MGGGLPPLAEASPRLYGRPEEPRVCHETNPYGETLRDHGETIMRHYETPEGNERLPLYDFRLFFPTFLGGCIAQVQSRHVVSPCQVYCSPVSLVIF